MYKNVKHSLKPEFCIAGMVVNLLSVLSYLQEMLYGNAEVALALCKNIGRKLCIVYSTPASIIV